MSKTPFEIRLELLKMAKDLLTDTYYSKREPVQNHWHYSAEAAKEHGLPVPPAPEFGNFPDDRDIVSLASKLNEFVSHTK